MELLKKRNRSRGGERDKSAIHCITMSPYSKTSRILLKLTKLLVQMDFLWNPVKDQVYTKANVMLYECRRADGQGGLD